MADNDKIVHVMAATTLAAWTLPFSAGLKYVLPDITKGTWKLR